MVGEFDKPPDFKRETISIEGEPKRSDNVRLERIFATDPAYLNREYTLPGAVDEQPIFLDQLVLDQPSLQEVLQDHLRVVTLPQTIATLQSEVSKDKVRILASPYECGRLLEIDASVDIDNTPHVLTIKGAGATHFFRQTFGFSPIMPLSARFHIRGASSSERAQLQEFAFAGRWGLLDRQEAEQEMAMSSFLRNYEGGIDAERILAIYKITALPDNAGVLQSIEYFKNHGLIISSVEPVLMVRASKTNFRLTDPVVLDEKKMHSSIRPLLEAMREQYAQIFAKENTTLTDYLCWLIRKILQQELPLMLHSYRTSSGQWQDLGRNLSLLGEELDVGEITQNPQTLRSEVRYHELLRLQSRALEEALLQFIGVANQYTESKLDLGKVADLFYTEYKSAIARASLSKIYGQMSAHRNSKTTQEFQEEVWCDLARVAVSGRANIADIDVFLQRLEDRFTAEH